ncbi:MAG: L,D-transpeptidase family protein [Cyclobacteriaceae bacterium]
MLRIFTFTGLAFLMAMISGCSSKTVVLESTGNELDLNNQEERVVLGKAKEIENEDVKKLISNWLDTINIENYVAQQQLRAPIYKELNRFYKFNLYQLAWSTLDAPNGQSKTLLNTLAQARDHGLNPDDYGLRQLVYETQQVYSRRRQVNLLEVIQLDMNMSLAYLTYTQHIFNGRLSPTDLGGHWKNEDKNAELAAYLSGKDVNQVLSMIAPEIEGYRELKEELANYRSIAERGGWPSLPENTGLKEGDNGDAVYRLRQRLTDTGDMTRSLSKQSGSSSFFDPSLTEAVKIFQTRHGLEPSGELDPATLRELNRPVEERIEQIKVNLERLRWMPRQLESDRIMINVPAYTLEYYKSGRVQERSRVLVGKEFSPTPIFHAEMEYIVFSPSWNIPGPVFYRDILPKVKDDPSYLQRNGYVLYATVYDVGKKPLDPNRIDWSKFSENYPHFKVIQLPGPENANGHIKFVFPNDYNFFLSDASSSDDFDQTRRAMNYRCISLEKAKQLAESLLNSRKWRISDIEKGMESEKPVKASLRDKIPVYITYRTCWVDENGIVNFRPDIYGYDAAQFQMTRAELAFEEDF